jgi:hypothetical protein
MPFPKIRERRRIPRAALAFLITIALAAVIAVAQGKTVDGFKSDCPEWTPLEVMVD